MGCLFGFPGPPILIGPIEWDECEEVCIDESNGQTSVKITIKHKCPKPQTAVCDCGPPVDTYCDPPRRRVLMDNSTDSNILAPSTYDCLANRKCYDMFSGYNVITQTPQGRCREFDCSADELSLFEDSVDEMALLLPCNSTVCLGSYEYINDDVERTKEEGEEFCRSEFDGSLAIINTEEQLQCACDLIGDGPSPFIGLFGIKHNEKHFFKNSDGTICPAENNGDNIGACVGSQFWEHSGPLPCDIGSRCVRVLPTCKLNNDVMCKDKLSGVLCSKSGPYHGMKTAHIGIIDNIDNIDNNDPNQFAGAIILIAIIIVSLLANIFVCYFCVWRDKENKRKKYSQQYEHVQAGDQENI